MSRIAPMFAQLYIYATKNEIQNIHASKNFEFVTLEIVSRFSAMLDEYNTHVKSFKMAKEQLLTYNMPSVSIVGALIVGDVDNPSKRDIILDKKSGKLKRINELHTSYLGYQYPLLFLYGEDGYRHDVCYSSTHTIQYKRNRVTIKD
ncbi:hypothetical protein Lal_00026522 [Lupinus albus]|nr:hypothetical protein Lal_00026522 [Lupinus albus]